MDSPSVEVFKSVWGCLSERCGPPEAVTVMQEPLAETV